jgi:hypothetical protein
VQRSDKEETMRKASLAAFVVLLASSLSTSAVLAKGHEAKEHGPVADANQGSTETVTWWCVNLNDLWHVDAPVIIGRVDAQPPDPSPIADPCSTPFPIAVPSGSGFMPGGTFVWYTNKTYPPAIRSALAAQGYVFKSQSPAEDFKGKMVQLRVEIWSLDQSEVVAEYSFDPQRNFRLVRVRELFGQLPFDPIVNPALGIDISPAEIGRLPLYGFPVTAGPLPLDLIPGVYWAAVYWTLSDLHNDGLGLEDGNFLPAGEFLYGANRFLVAP